MIWSTIDRVATGDGERGGRVQVDSVESMVVSELQERPTGYRGSAGAWG